MNSLVSEQRPSAATAPQKPFRKRKPKLSTIKYGSFFVMIFMMITAVKVYLNYANIQQNIIDVRAKIQQRQKDMQYVEIQNDYYHSAYAQKLIAHQQGILLANEQFVLFEHTDGTTSMTTTGNKLVATGHVLNTGTSLAPLASRKLFFETKIQSIR